MRRLPVIDASPLPPRYAGWMRDALGGELPREENATCGACAMVPAEGAPHDEAAVGFDARAKCCTHTPFLPNFLVGAALRDRGGGAVGARGRASLRARVRERLVASPLGLHAPAPRRALEAHAHAHGDFGRVAALVCPHYVDARGGLCGVWSHRNAVCATFFCKHERGARGDRLWRAVERLLRSVEDALARHCLLALDLPAEALARALALARPSEGEPTTGAEFAADYARHRALWGPWTGREEALYAACADLVAPLAWADVRRIGGAELEANARVARQRYEDALRPAPLDALAASTLSGAQVGAEFTRVTTYSKLDPLALPNALLAALGRFDGRDTALAREEIRREHALEVGDEVLQTLVDFEVLVPAAAPDEAVPSVTDRARARPVRAGTARGATAPPRGRGRPRRG